MKFLKNRIGKLVEERIENEIDNYDIEKNAVNEMTSKIEEFFNSGFHGEEDLEEVIKTLIQNEFKLWIEQLYGDEIEEIVAEVIGNKLSELPLDRLKEILFAKK